MVNGFWLVSTIHHSIWNNEDSICVILGFTVTRLLLWSLSFKYVWLNDSNTGFLGKQRTKTPAGDKHAGGSKKIPTDEGGRPVCSWETSFIACDPVNEVEF